MSHQPPKMCWKSAHKESEREGHINIFAYIYIYIYHFPEGESAPRRNSRKVFVQEAVCIQNTTYTYIYRERDRERERKRERRRRRISFQSNLRKGVG